jgi:acetyl-CoA synthetase
MPRIRCSFFTPPAPQANPRAWFTPPLAISCTPASRTSTSSTFTTDDIYWCTADIGWVTGHSYIVYGPLCNGATSVMFEGVPTFPDAGRFWQVVQKYKVTVFYTAPTAIRSLIRLGEEWPNKYDLSTLRDARLGGRTHQPEAWMWYYRVIGKERCPIVDTWWQTETGAILITPCPARTP